MVKMKNIWFYGLAEGNYTIAEIKEKTNVSYSRIYQTFKRFNVESFYDKKEKDYNKRNEKLWVWKGDEFYLKGHHNG